MVVVMAVSEGRVWACVVGEKEGEMRGEDGVGVSVKWEGKGCRQRGG